MCLLFLVWQHHPSYRLILLANRDEFYRRPSSPACFWRDSRELLAGRDEERGGTWLGIRRGGRWAALTNYRDPSASLEPTSRGTLVTQYLEGAESPAEFTATLAGNGSRYSGFNIIVGDDRSASYYSNRGESPQALGPGVYGLSNHLLDTTWPKITLGKRRLQSLLQQPIETDALFNLLGDRTVAEDDALPDTGVGPEWERILSPAFITSSEYGTRSATVLLVSDQDEMLLEERSYVPDAEGNYGPLLYNEVAYTVIPEIATRHSGE
jgi:uncharacterized protein with NRDE domain